MDDNYTYRSIGGASLAFRAKALPGDVLLPLSAPASRDGQSYQRGNPLATERDDDLVMLPWRASQVFPNATINGSTLRGGQYHNDDGSATCMRVSVPTSATGANAGELSFRIRGNVFGLRWSPSPDATNTQLSPIGCLIDRQAFEVPVATPRDPLTMAALSGGYANALVGSRDRSGFTGAIIARDLGDGDHLVELQLPCALSGNDRKWELAGLVVEAKAGYQAPARLTDYGVPLALSTLTTGASRPAVGVEGWGGSTLSFRREWRALKGLRLLNPTGAAITLKLFRNTSDTNPIDQVTLAAGGRELIEFAGGGAIWTPLYYEISAAGLIATPFGTL